MKLSVCLASYNGSRYIREQLASIVEQLRPHDELIVCDDGSRDDTHRIVQSMNDPRVVLHTFAANVGHVRNFERAIALAKGDIIFLSDQDDVWEPGKVEQVVRCFEAHPNVQLVHHAVSTMDSEGRTLAPLWNPLPPGLRGRLPYLLRQLVKCQIFGCAVAFRRSMVPVVLPFPRTVYAHDHWLAVVAGVCGSVFFLNTPLVRYRQHQSNLTPKKGLSWPARFSVRWKLLKLLGVALYRRSLGGSSAAAPQLSR